MINGGIFGDEDEMIKQDLIEEEPVLDLSEEQKEKAQEKMNEGTLFAPSDEEEEKEESQMKIHSNRKVPEVDEVVIEKVREAIEDFEPEFANKRAIRNLRKALQEFSLIRYPRKAKKKKNAKKK